MGHTDCFALFAASCFGSACSSGGGCCICGAARKNAGASRAAGAAGMPKELSRIHSAETEGIFIR